MLLEERCFKCGGQCELALEYEYVAAKCLNCGCENDIKLTKAGKSQGVGAMKPVIDLLPGFVESYIPSNM